MQITITTDGGFTGRGLGTASADVDVADVHPESWRDEYTAPGADLIRYTLTPVMGGLYVVAVVLAHRRKTRSS